MSMTANDMRRLAAEKDHEAARLIERYGEGARPGWVSEELAMIRESARRLRDEAAQLQESA